MPPFTRVNPVSRQSAARSSRPSASAALRSLATPPSIWRSSFGRRSEGGRDQVDLGAVEHTTAEPDALAAHGCSLWSSRAPRLLAMVAADAVPPLDGMFGHRLGDEGARLLLPPRMRPRRLG